MNLFFSTSNTTLFFLSYEAILFPIAGLILIVGIEPERINSRLYILMYTIVGSIPFLIGGLLLTKESNTFFIEYIKYTKISWEWCICLIFTFLVKLPMWGVHLWLPLAHVFSPLVGSIILAGIILKAGAYGIHIVLHILDSRVWILFLLRATAAVGSGLSFFSGISNSDAKAIIAFSRIIHIAWVIIFFAWGGPICEIGLIRLLVSHGIRRPLLFRIVGNSREIGSRSLMYSANLAFPLISIFILALAVNAGVPPSLNFVGEACCFIRVGYLSYRLTGIFFVVFVLGGLYSLYIWIRLYNPDQPSNFLKFSFIDFIMSIICILFGIVVW